MSLLDLSLVSIARAYLGDLKQYVHTIPLYLMTFFDF